MQNRGKILKGYLECVRRSVLSRTRESIFETSQNRNKCVASSHQAIVDDPYKIGKIVKNAQKLLYHPGASQYLYYYKSLLKEWVVIIQEYGTTGIYELRTAFRVACPFPKECEKGNEIIEVLSYLDILECQGFKIISMW